MVKVTVNGLEVQQIQGMIDGIKKQPQAAQAKFYSKTTWKSGFFNEVSVKDFSLGGTKNETSRVNPFIIMGDHPPELLGTNKGATSVEVLLASLGICIASGFAVYGAHMGVAMDSLVVELEGDIDLQGMLGLPEPGKVRPGYQAIRAKYYVKSKAPKEQLEKLAKMSEDLSPTKDSLRAVAFSSQVIIR
ncbi:hypothetical protein A3K69_04310 [Candidatus Bathyarchaeota archaeon RBG_16_57_9]|nr:MAG: hypothetical protein A3K69_04310 [Candidatus Bathyarchaeota archaeon RBG_16_57_9]